MCGEKLLSVLQIRLLLGSPPRMRGKDRPLEIGTECAGITPAYAGKRVCRFVLGILFQDHPRVCGEKRLLKDSQSVCPGSPPRMRGKVKHSIVIKFNNGITPAYAGKSLQKPLTKRTGKDHPRMCGEKASEYTCPLISLGSPPHVRGKACATSRRACAAGITPACAGKRLKRSRSTVPPVAIVPLFPSVCNKPVVSDGSPAGRDAPLFLPAENAVPASPAYNLRSL